MHGNTKLRFYACKIKKKLCQKYVNTINPSLIQFKSKYTDLAIYLHTDFYGDDSYVGTLPNAVLCSHRLALFSTAINSVSCCYSLKQTYIITKLTSTCSHILALYIIISISHCQPTSVMTEQEALSVLCNMQGFFQTSRETICLGCKPTWRVTHL